MKKTKAAAPGLFPSMEKEFAAADQSRAAAGRRARVADHLKSMRCCWPEWDGNDGIVVGTRCECGSCIAELAEDFMIQWPDQSPPLLAGQRCYQYTAPVFIAEVIDPETFIGVVDYPPTSQGHVTRYNGMRLKLDITDIWPPVRLLIAARHTKEEDRRK